MSETTTNEIPDGLDAHGFSLFRRTLLAGLGVTLLMIDGSQSLFERLVERGLDERRPDPYTDLPTPVQEHNGHAARRRLAYRRPRPVRNPDGEIEAALQSALEQRGLVGRADIGAWSKQLDELNQQLDELQVG